MTREQIIRKITDTKDYYNVGTAQRMYAEYHLKEYEQQIRAEFAHELKETFNNELPSNYASTQPFFTLENVRALVDMTLKENK